MPPTSIRPPASRVTAQAAGGSIRARRRDRVQAARSVISVVPEGRAANHALQQAWMRQMADATIGAVAETHRMHRGQIARLAFCQKAVADRRDQCIGYGMSGARAAD